MHRDSLLFQTLDNSVNSTLSTPTSQDACLQQAYHLTRQAEHANSPHLHFVRDQLLAAFRRQGDDTRMLALVEEELQRLREIYPSRHPSLRGMLLRAVHVYEEVGHVNKARRALKEASEMLCDAPVL